MKDVEAIRSKMQEAVEHEEIAGSKTQDCGFTI